MTSSFTTCSVDIELMAVVDRHVAAKAFVATKAILSTAKKWVTQAALLSVVSLGGTIIFCNDAATNNCGILRVSRSRSHLN